MIGRIRPYGLHLALLTYTPIILVVDSRITSGWEQAGLGAVTALVLWLCTRSLPRHERWQVWLCVVVATGFEIFGSLIWGVYRYRWHNVPLYVPFGHGLVYFFGLTAAGLPVFRRYGRRAAYVVLGACTAWVLGGLTLLPLVTHRLDVQGALIFVATTDLELVGTWCRDWAWLPTAPWTGVPSGNPPSAIAGGYSIIDGSVALVLALLVRLGVAPLAAGRPSASVDDVGPDAVAAGLAPTFPGADEC